MAVGASDKNTPSGLCLACARSRIVKRRRTLPRQLPTRVEGGDAPGHFKPARLRSAPRDSPSSFDSALKSPDLQLRSKPTYGVRHYGASVCLLYLFFAVICPL
ncbi:hypothetical protein MRX96_006570 [Rhipicephalus microplus]